MLLGESEGRRGVNRHHPGESNNHHESIGRSFFGGRSRRITTEMVANYSVFANKMTNPCGFHRIVKRSKNSVPSKSISNFAENSNPSKRTVDLVFKLVNIFRDTFLGGGGTPSLLTKLTSSVSDASERSRRETVEAISQLDVKKLELSNLVSGIEFIIQENLLLQVSCITLEIIKLLIIT